MNTAVLSATSSSVSGALTTIAGEITSTVGEVAPVAIGIVGVFLCWKFGMRFFKSLAK